MNSHIVGEFAKHLSDKNYVVGDLSLRLKSSDGYIQELSLRRLWLIFYSANSQVVE